MPPPAPRWRIPSSSAAPVMLARKPHPSSPAAAPHPTCWRGSPTPPPQQQCRTRHVGEGAVDDLAAPLAGDPGVEDLAGAGLQ